MAPPKLRFSPGCRNCCSNCKVCEDSFARANDTDVATGSACGWTEVAGDWSISSNALTVSSTSAILKGMDVPDGDGRIELRATCTVSASTGRVRLIVNYTDANNFHYVEWRCHTSTGTFVLVRRVAGTDTVLQSKANLLAAGSVVNIRVCIRGGWIYSELTYLSSLVTLEARITPAITPSPKWAVGTGTTLPGSATFTNVQVFKYADGDTQCNECRTCGDGCLAGTEPTSQIIVPLDLVNGATLPFPAPAPCTGCPPLSGDYLCNGITRDGNGCNWGYTNALVGSGPQVTSIQIIKYTSDGHFEVAVVIQCFRGFPQPHRTEIFWESDPPDDIDCNTITLHHTLTRYRNGVSVETSGACEQAVPAADLVIEMVP